MSDASGHDRERARLPHVVMDRESRIWKARKIVALIGQDRFLRARRILEIGCGSGVIASTLATMGAPGLEVHAVDVVDSRSETAGFDFHLVHGTTLPFESAAFDLVISNHVIEHVGPEREQLLHLDEIRRVLASGGLAYLAVPNRWRLVEPHFRLPFLSWLPQPAADRYVRWAGRGAHYDCLPLSLRGALGLLRETGFEATDATMDAFRATIEIEFAPGTAVSRLARAIPRWMLKPVEPLMPTFVFLLRAVSS